MSQPPSVPEQLWFLDTHVSVRVSEREGTDGISILEHAAPFGDSPPLHLHRREDEIFHVLEGELRFVIDQQERRLGSGEIVLVPKGVAHTYRVESLQGARWLTVTARGDFERFVRGMGRVAEHAGLPEPAGGAPTPEAIQTLSAAALQYGIELIGPPLH